MAEFLFYYKKVLLKNYFNFNGRARRKEYWMFVAVNIVATIVISIIGGIIDYTIASVLSSLYALAVLLPGLGVTVRRLHDIGKGGIYILIALIPLVGAIILLIWECKEGQIGENQYGPDPKELA